MARGKKTEKTLTPEEKLAQARVPAEEQPYPIPENWCWLKLLETFENYTDGKKKIQQKAYLEDGMLAVVDQGKELIGGFTNDENMAYSGELPVIVFGDHTRCVKYIDFMFAQGADGVKVLKPKPFYSPKAFFYSLQAVDIPNMGYRRHFPLFHQYAMPLPPFTEQQRIVTRIESLFAKLDEAKEKAQAGLDGFETRKAAILYKAFTGELTAKWRRSHGLSLSGWRELPWGDFIVSIQAGKNWLAENRSPQLNEFGIVKVSAVTWGEFNEDESKTCTEMKQWNDAIQICSGDFLFSRANTLQLVGNCVIVNEVTKHLMLSDKILRFKFNDNISAHYVLYYTRSKRYRSQVEALASGNQDGMRNISQKNLKKIVFPVPSHVEQMEIVRILDSLFSKERIVKETAEAVLEQIDTMKKSILARAFRGELGTNDPAEENATEVLKRLCCTTKTL